MIERPKYLTQLIESKELNKFILNIKKRGIYVKKN